MQDGHVTAHLTVPSACTSVSVQPAPCSSPPTPSNDEDFTASTPLQPPSQRVRGPYGARVRSTPDQGHGVAYADRHCAGISTCPPLYACALGGSPLQCELVRFVNSASPAFEMKSFRAGQ